MSDQLTIDGVISTGAEAPLRADSSLRSGSGLNLPLAGAVLLHFVALGLVLALPRLGGERELPPLVHSVRLYSVAEVVAAGVTEGRPVPVAAPVRAAMATVSRLAVPADAAPSPGPVQEVAAPMPVSAVAESAPLASAPAAGAAVANVAESRPGASLALSAPTHPVTAPANETGASATAAAAAPLELAHPLYRENPEPEYPPLARRRGLAGTVVLEVLVEVSGQVGGLVVHHSSGQRLLDEAALKSVKGWRFAPGHRGGEPLAMKVLVPVRFALR